MIPLRDKNPTRKFPIVTVLLIIINVLMFFYQLSLGNRLDDLFFNYGMIPNKIVHLDFANPLIILTLLTSIFLHGGWLHLVGNMLYLWVFGDNVEDKMGRMRFLLFYILCGVSASILHIIIEPTSMIPTIGASGSISGVLGAYLLMFPKARVVTLIPIFVFIQITELPAFIILGLWFILQFINGMISLGYETAGMGGVAWWAHIGGFVAGMILLIPFRRYK